MKFLVRKAPSHFLRTVNDEINSLLNRHFDSYFPEAAYLEDDELFSMPVEIEDKGKNYCIKADLPGIDKENVEVDIDKNYLVINAHRKEENKTEENSYKKTEFKYGKFSRTIYFPEEIEIDGTEAEMNNGVLKIHAPKKQTKHEDKKKLTIK